jgi:uncharacterized protein (DUF1330 family)
VPKFCNLMAALVPTAGKPAHSASVLAHYLLEAASLQDANFCKSAQYRKGRSIMNNRPITIGLALVAGAAIGAAAVQSLHAQAGPRAYVVTTPNPADQDGYGKNYAAFVPASFQPFGGRYLVRGGKKVVFDGNPPNVVIIEFDSLEKAQAWRNSEVYKALVPARDKAIGSGTYQSMVMEGVPN